MADVATGHRSNPRVNFYVDSLLGTHPESKHLRRGSIQSEFSSRSLANELYTQSTQKFGSFPFKKTNMFKSQRSGLRIGLGRDSLLSPYPGSVNDGGGIIDSFKPSLLGKPYGPSLQSCGPLFRAGTSSDVMGGSAKLSQRPTIQKPCESLLGPYPGFLPNGRGYKDGSGSLLSFHASTSRDKTIAPVEQSFEPTNSKPGESLLDLYSGSMYDERSNIKNFLPTSLLNEPYRGTHSCDSSFHASTPSDQTVMPAELCSVPTINKSGESLLGLYPLSTCDRRGNIENSPKPSLLSGPYRHAQISGPSFRASTSSDRVGVSELISAPTISKPGTSLLGLYPRSLSDGRNNLEDSSKPALLSEPLGHLQNCGPSSFHPTTSSERIDVSAEFSSVPKINKSGESLLGPYPRSMCDERGTIEDPLKPSLLGEPSGHFIHNCGPSPYQAIALSGQTSALPELSSMPIMDKPGTSLLGLYPGSLRNGRNNLEDSPKPALLSEPFGHLQNCGPSSFHPTTSSERIDVSAEFSSVPKINKSGESLLGPYPGSMCDERGTVEDPLKPSLLGEPSGHFFHNCGPSPYQAITLSGQTSVLPDKPGESLLGPYPGSTCDGRSNIEDSFKPPLLDERHGHFLHGCGTSPFQASTSSDQIDVCAELCPVPIVDKPVESLLGPYPGSMRNERGNTEDFPKPSLLSDPYRHTSSCGPPSFHTSTSSDQMTVSTGLCTGSTIDKLGESLLGPYPRSMRNGRDNIDSSKPSLLRDPYRCTLSCGPSSLHARTSSNQMAVSTKFSCEPRMDKLGESLLGPYPGSACSERSSVEDHLKPSLVGEPYGRFLHNCDTPAFPANTSSGQIAAFAEQCSRSTPNEFGQSQLGSYRKLIHDGRINLEDCSKPTLFRKLYKSESRQKQNAVIFEPDKKSSVLNYKRNKIQNYSRLSKYGFSNKRKFRSSQSLGNSRDRSENVVERGLVPFEK